MPASEKTEGKVVIIVRDDGNEGYITQDSLGNAALGSLRRNAIEFADEDAANLYLNGPLGTHAWSKVSLKVVPA